MSVTPDDRKTFVSRFVIEKLKHFNDGESGVLFIDEDANEQTITALLVPKDRKLDPTKDMDIDEICVPLAAAPLGLFYCTAHLEPEKGYDLIAQVHPETKEIKLFYECDTQLKPLDFQILNERQLAEKFFVVRARGSIPFKCELSIDGIEEATEQLRQRLDEAVIVPQLAHLELNKPYPFSATKRQINSLRDMDIVDCTFKLKRSDTETLLEDPEPRKAFAIDYVIKPLQCCSFPMNLDALVVINRTASVALILHLIEVDLKRNLSLMSESLNRQLLDSKTISLPQVYHFLPDNTGHFISLVYPKNKLDRDLGDVRAHYHKKFALPTDRPLLMRGNAFAFSAEQEGCELENPHLKVGPSGIDGGEPALVHGLYRYHHYCQRGEDDDGWGCAYRSLQTLCSWFKLQGYTNRSVPTIREIQQCLVSIGDKPSSFVGSRQWIGSTEVGFCLDTLLGISSRIINVSSGEEMSMKGGELTHHFKNQGTPVMIGGGNLAHTILGVDYNKKTGDIKFLILDPHYTGSEDLNIIISKGWCGWKGINFWKKNSFYNMCLPIRPNCI